MPAYEPDSLGSLRMANIENAPRVTGPEYGFAIGTLFGGPFFLGFFDRQAMTFALTFQFIGVRRD